MHGLPLGWETGARPEFGFGPPEPASTGQKLIHYTGDEPLTVIAPTGAGKGTGVLIPLLLDTPDNVIVIDIKGELAAVTARRRRELGQKVAIIDPFGITGRESDRIDPFELFDLPGSLLECDAEMLASMLISGVGHSREPFWDASSASLNAGLIAMAATLRPEREPGLAFLRKYLFCDDPIYNIAVLVDTEARRNPYAFGELAAFLQHAERDTRPTVLASARTVMRDLNSPQVAACFDNPTIRLKDVMDGAPLDIYLVIPPDKLVSHGGLLRLIVGTLLTTIMRRRHMPRRRTLFVLDEAAQLGSDFQPLLTASTLMRGYGMGLVTAWQDLAQMKARYPKDWATILNNSGAVIAFGMGHHAAAKDLAEVLGVEPAKLLELPPENAVMAVRGQGTRQVRRMDYLRDRMFAGRFDPNPFYELAEGMER